MDKVVAIIQARMGSTRLPGKILKKVKGKTVLEHVVYRVQQAKQIDKIVIATTELEQDHVVAEKAISCGIRYFRGSEDDVLSRYYHAAKENNADIVVRITSDCPLIDSKLIDKMVQFYKENNYVFVTNVGNHASQRTYPRGLDTEIFSFQVLETAFYNAKEKYQREHVTPYIYENERKIYYYRNDVDYSAYRWTLDTEEDFQLISAVYGYLYDENENFGLGDILKLMEKHPELIKLNEHVEQKKIK
ncbi:cytidylyltransferase domain-containing protein [Thermotalea metallivorans]|uniref:3-deoxy-manno-octulosonate cytidylyltransferase n=1 Tax=Thermotalea metallivorans TaxID=520762 RepID=A0A140L723_9FIRM|nr:glycosyltransferase family protein [Thermotalea metallivorans]KXG76348.1 3-deoxy-manno-octulosonate cytidylyltransferase [Thermotalea metallivorans]